MINTIMLRQGLAMVFKKRWGLLLPLVFVFLLTGYFGVREFWRWYGIHREYRGIVREVSDLNQKSELLKTELDSLTQPDFLEKEARARLNLKKEGEAVLVVVSEDSFPQEDFFKAEVVSIFDKEGTVWFNIKSWLDYFWSK